MFVVVGEVFPWNYAENGFEFFIPTFDYPRRIIDV
jgi:hypothetical protein